MTSTSKLLSLAALAAASAGLLFATASTRGQATTRPASASPTTVPSAVAPFGAGRSASPLVGAATRPAALAGATTAPSTRPGILAGATTAPSTRPGGLGASGIRGTTGTIGAPAGGGSTSVFGNRGGTTTRPAGSGTGSASVFPGRGNGTGRGPVATAPPAGDMIAINMPAAMPVEYATEFSKRSIFQKGLPYVAPPVQYVAPPPAGPSQAQLAAQQLEAARARLESQSLFNGAAIEKINGKDVPIAFIENTVSFPVTRVKVGDAIARGTITFISLTELHYKAASGTRVIPIGYSLAGDAYLRSTTRPSVLEVTELLNNTATTQKTGEALGADDLLTQMKLRRQAELTGLSGLSLPGDAPTTQPAKAVVQPADQTPAGADQTAPADEN